MSDDTPAIDRGLLRRLDWAQPPQGQPPRSASDLPHAPPPPVDVTAVIEAVHHLATSMSTMAERIRELEAHAEAFATSNEELEANNRQLAEELSEAIHERESLAASLATEGKRLRQLERYASLGIARASKLKRDLSTAHTDLARIVTAVGGRLAADASASAEDPAMR